MWPDFRFCDFVSFEWASACKIPPLLSPEERGRYFTVQNHHHTILRSENQMISCQILAMFEIALPHNFQIVLARFSGEFH
jgi:hypothetical protein